jgi:hypothetical protein
MSEWRYPAPWSVEEMDGGYRVHDATGYTIVYVSGRSDEWGARIARIHTMDNARRIALAIARLPELLAASDLK